MDFPIFPFEIIELIADHLVDSRPIYLTNRRLYANSPDRIYWESRGGERIRNHLVKIHTRISMVEFAKYGNLQMARHLYRPGSGFFDDSNNNALQWACVSGHLNVVKFLHSVGVDITAKNNFAVKCASELGYIEVVKFLHSVGANVTVSVNYAVRWAIKNNHIEVVRFLHSVGADITAMSREAVRFVIGNGRLEMLKLLCSLGTNVTFDNNYAIQIASERGHIEVVNYLLENGAVL